jgi:hypothetical protein
MDCERTAMANDPGAHLIARMDRLQVDVSHINWELEKLQLRLRRQKIAIAIFWFGLVFGILFSRCMSP